MINHALQLVLIQRTISRPAAHGAWDGSPSMLGHPCLEVAWGSPWHTRADHERSRRCSSRPACSGAH